MKTEDEKLLQEAIDILYESGSIEYSEKFAKNLLTKAWQDLEPTLLPGCDAKLKLEELSEYLIDRDIWTKL